MATQPFQIPTNSLIVRIKNVASGSYLYESAGQADLGMLPASDLPSQWIIEDYQGSQGRFPIFWRLHPVYGGMVCSDWSKTHPG